MQRDKGDHPDKIAQYDHLRSGHGVIVTFLSYFYDTSLITLLPLRILLPAPGFGFFSNIELKMWSFLDSILSSLLFSIHICSAMG